MTLIITMALPAELFALFAIWNWRIRGRPIGWLVVGCLTLICLAGMTTLLPTSFISRIYLGFAGMYLLSALLWTWWADGVSPTQWKLGEIGVAALTLAIFACANIK